MRAGHPGLEAGITAMVAHFCALYDDDPALFRFMLLTQHGLLPRIASGSRTPVDAVADLVRDAASREPAECRSTPHWGRP